MNKRAEPIRVRVEAPNPGQFFACCGALEIADRLWPGAQGWFEGSDFCISGTGSLEDVLDALLARQAEQVTRIDRVDVKPLIAPLRIALSAQPRGVFTLDAWMRLRIDKGVVVAAPNPPWNFWSGQQTSLRIWTALRETLMAQRADLRERGLHHLFEVRVPITGRFGFDPGAAWNALDLGFSPNEQAMEVGSSPAVELLAAVGLQRFRPTVAPSNETFIYATWQSPLSPPVAAVAAAGLLDAISGTRFRGRVVSRGSYAALGYATTLKGTDYE